MRGWPTLANINSLKCLAEPCRAAQLCIYYKQARKVIGKKDYIYSQHADHKSKEIIKEQVVIYALWIRITRYVTVPVPMKTDLNAAIILI